MSQILMFNPSNLHQQFVDQSNSAAIDKMMGMGWIRNPVLIHMFHPGTQDNKMVQIQDKPIWEHKGYYAEPTFIYHPVEGAKVVSAEEAKKALNQGWYASPAYFPGNDTGGTTLETRAKLTLKGAA